MDQDVKYSLEKLCDAIRLLLLGCFDVKVAPNVDVSTTQGLHFTAFS